MPKYNKIHRALGRRRAVDLKRKQAAENRRIYQARQQRRQAQKAEWKRRKKIVKRYRELRQTEKEKDAAQITAAEFGVSPRTVRRYDQMVRTHNWHALWPKTRAPQRVSRWPLRTIALILAVRMLTGWGPARLAYALEEEAGHSMSHTGVWKVLKRHKVPCKRYHPVGKRAGIAYRRYQRKHPNSLWHIDTKACTRLLLGLKVTLLLVEDDMSRYCVGAFLRLGDANSQWVAECLSTCIARYGRPRQILSDNAAELKAAMRALGFSKEPEIIGQDEHITCAPYYPQTNGKVEALIRTVLRECLDLVVAQRQREGSPITTLVELQEILDQWVLYYNNYRWHSAIKDAPVNAYTGGKRTRSRGLWMHPLLAPIRDHLTPLSEPPPRVDAEYLKRCWSLAVVDPLPTAS